MQNSYKELIAEISDSAYKLGEKHGKKDTIINIWNILKEQKEEKIDKQVIIQFLAELLDKPL